MSDKSSSRKTLNTPLLCLACSSSLPARQELDTVFFTPCCSRPICPACISTNPRLERYNPCLRCLGGVSAVKARHTATPDPKASSPLNLDGGIHDENVFTVGDEDDDGDDSDEEDGRVSEFDLDEASTLSSTIVSESSVTSDSTGPRQSYEPMSTPEEMTPSEQSGYFEDQNAEAAENTLDSAVRMVPAKYYIHPGDTLLGISLKFGIDARVICRMNNLPPSTIRTTPHLLHTRSYITLPASGPIVSGDSLNTPPISEEEEEERKSRRTRERAEKRFQTVTKEVDWRIAKAYVAVAEYSDPFDDHTRGKEEEITSLENKVGNSYADGVDLSLESLAVDRYLDDDEWEERERKTGKGVFIPSFPSFASGSRRSSSSMTSPKRRDSWMTSTWLKWGN